MYFHQRLYDHHRMGESWGKLGVVGETTQGNTQEWGMDVTGGNT
jgi:hypothetical protein